MAQIKSCSHLPGKESAMNVLKDKIVLVTGGSQGYGKATARHFVDENAIVIIAARNEGDLITAKSEIRCADCLVMDVTEPSDWDRVCDDIKSKYGRLDILINNAGGGISIKQTTELTIQDIDAILALNLNSVIYGSRIFGNLMKQQGCGTIINVSSVCGKHAWPSWSVYGAAKAGVVSFSKGLYVELREYGVRVTCVIPAAGSTDFMKHCGEENLILKLQPEDIGKTILDICALPEHVVVEEITVWSNDLGVVPL
jgi:NADP-dependent 3-hydroxy acid dehydrogenase YdfG